MRAEATFAGQLPSFPDVRAWAEAFATAVGAERHATLRLVLILEELFTNTVTHGYRAGTEGPVRVALASQTGAIEVIYEDSGPAFDPLTDAPARRADPRATEGQEPGGLGLALVRGLTASVRYVRVAGRNRITLTVPTGGPPGPPSAATR